MHSERQREYIMYRLTSLKTQYWSGRRKLASHMKIREVKVPGWKKNKLKTSEAGIGLSVVLVFRVGF